MYYVYLLSSKKYGTIYLGVTNDLVRRTYEHKSKEIKGFTKKYDVMRLVYFERFETIESAILREKQIKNWKRQWKIDLIEKDNPHWVDLYSDIIK